MYPAIFYLFKPESANDFCGGNEPKFKRANFGEYRENEQNRQMRFFCFHKKLNRSNPNTPDELKICIRAARKELKYGIPILKVKNYTLEDIFERRLWMLIPFYIFRYEKELSQNRQR